jgi:hypothetical protein
MVVSLLLVDKNSRRYRPHTDQKVKPKALPDVVVSLPKGKCAHYHFFVNEQTGLSEKVYCTNDALKDRANGLLCNLHTAMVFPTQKKPAQFSVADGAQIAIEDAANKLPTDLHLVEPVKMRRVTNKRPRNDWDVALDQLAIDLIDQHYTAAGVRQLIEEDLGWDLTDSRTVYLLRYFVNQ